MSSESRTIARVLFVDDSRMIREIAQDGLADRVQLECCATAEDALESLARTPADLVISDLNMPGLSGIDLLERVRRDHPGTDFVLLTANATVESAVEALRRGAADYLIKPIQPEALALVVDRILDQRRLLQENVRLRDTLSTLESCRSLMLCLDPSELYAVTLDLLLSSLQRSRGIAIYRRGAIPISDGVAFRGFREDEARRMRDVFVGEKPIDLDSILAVEVVAESGLHDTLRALGVSAAPTIVVPLRGRESEAGAIWIFDGERGFDAAEFERVELIAAHAQLALQNAERYNHAKERAFIDDVTEVYNARYLLQATAHEIQRAERYGRKLSVLFLDLDRFKLVNDEFGHLVGSRVLRQLSEVLAGCIRQVDTLARYGGDEFTILLIDTDHEVALTIAERIRRVVADTRFEGGHGVPIHLEISIGAATYPEHSQRRDSLLDTADKAMYLAKSRGRNCVCSASDLAD